MPARGQHRMIGEPGRFQSAADAIVHNGRLYTIDQDSHIYRWDLERVAYDPIGSGSWNTRIFLATPMWLVNMEADGSIYVVDPNNGGHSQIAGADSRWANATCAALAAPGELVICDEGGDLYRMNIENGSHQLMSGGEGWGASNMFNGEGYVHMLEPEGSVYKVGLDGAWEQVDADGDWSNTPASDGANGRLYMCCEGGMYWKDCWNGEWGQIGEATTWNPTMLFLGNGCLYSFEGDGTLWEIGI